MKLQIKAKFVVFVALFLIALTLLLFPTSTAFAVLPDGYIKDVCNEGLDWWTGEQGLDLATLKNTVETWRKNTVYDFESLEENPIVIAVIDSGIKLDHELFTGKYDENGKSINGVVDKNGVGQYDVLLRDKNGKAIVRNTVKDNENVADDDKVQKHGTHVAGIIATLIHSLDLEKYIKILPIKASYWTTISFGREGSLFTSEAVSNAVDFAIKKGAVVINMSLASSQKENSETFAWLNTSNAHESAVLVAAAGNDGEESGKRFKNNKWIDYTAYPAGNANFIGVMNCTEDGVLASSSNYGDKYDICAPGSSIYSANGASSTGYRNLSGTSMASPIVAFGAGLLAMKYRAIEKHLGKEYTPIDIAEKVKSAYSKTIGRKTESGAVVGEYPVFDINKLVGVGWRDAKIELESPEMSTQYLGQVSAVQLNLEVYPLSVQGSGKVEWFELSDVADEKIGEGFEIEYTPLSQIGTVKLKAVWTPERTEDDIDVIVPIERIFELKVDYLPLNGQTVKQIEMNIASDGNELTEFGTCTIGAPYTFTVGNMDNFAPISDENIMWFVNDRYEDSGRVFVFTPEDYGEYSVRAKINGVFLSPTVLTVPEIEEDKCFKYELAIYTLTAVAVIVVVVSVVTAVLVHKKRKSKSI